MDFHHWVCAFIWQRSDVELLMGKLNFCQCLTELFALDMSIFLFLAIILIFTKLGMCIDIVESWL